MPVDHYPFENLPLPYAHNALEPYIDTRTMHVHHDIQAQAYVDNLNYFLSDQPALQNMTLEQLINTAQTMEVSIGRPIVRNAGGVLNHRLYFNGMKPYAPGNRPKGELLAKMEQTYGSYERFMQRFIAVALSVFGSGYAWLVTEENGELGIIITINQETPIPMNLCPLMNVDCWEHAYYLKHYNNRSAYLDGWSNVINWDRIEERYLACPAWHQAESVDTPFLEGVSMPFTGL